MSKPLRAVEATFHGKCPSCGDGICEGQEIVADEDTWLHRECAEDNGTEVLDGKV